MNNFENIDVEKVAVKSYFILQKMKKIKTKSKRLCEDLDFLEEVIILLLSRNNQLHRELVDMEHRLQLVDWAFGGM